MEKANGKGSERQIPCGNERCEERRSCAITSKGKCVGYTPDLYEGMVTIQDCIWVGQDNRA